MRKWIALLCLAALCLAAASASAWGEPLVYTGMSGFTITLPADWFAIIGGDDYDDEDDFDEYLEPGEIEALFSSGDGMMSVTVLYAGGAPVHPHALEAVLGEAALVALVSQVTGYQKQAYEFDEANRRAYLSYSLIDTEDNRPHTEFLVGFITGSDIAQYVLIAVPADQLEAKFGLIGEIVNGIDIGGVREGAEG